MEASGVQTPGYIVPTYQAPPEAVWYHFLHGNVPGHQIDFMYRPEVPQGPLSHQNFSHLARLVKYIEPRTRSAQAFAIGNLSRDDTQYEPGHGAVALILGLRIQGAKDHAGRRDPPFCHAIAAIDKNLDRTSLLEAALAFHRKVQPSEDAQSPKNEWYHTYVRPGQRADALRPILESYVADFDDLPTPAPSALGLRWTSEGTPTPSRIVIIYAGEESFEAIASCAVRIAEVLVESDIRWTAISTGREADVPGGVSIRFVPEQDAGQEAADVPLFRLEDVPHDSRDIAEQLFGASEVRGSQMPELRMGWRQMYGHQARDADAQRTSENGPSVATRLSSLRPTATATAEVIVEVAEDGAEKSSRRDSGAEVGAKATSGNAGPKAITDGTEVKVDRGARKKARNQFGLLIGIALVLAVGGAVAAVLVGTKDSAADNARGLAPNAATSADAGGVKEPPPSSVMAHHSTSASSATTSTPAASGGVPLVAATESSSTEPMANEIPSKKRDQPGSNGARKKRSLTAEKPPSVFVVP